jgi:hypothetical protein
MVDEALRSLISGTADVGRPGAMTGLKAVAGKDTVYISWDPLGGGLANAVKHIRVEIRKAADGAWQAFEVRGGDFVYDFNRAVDGYPEASSLATWRVRAKAVNLYGQESIEYAPDAGGVSLDLSNYGTWKPSVPSLVVASSGRTVNVEAPIQTWYGAAGCEFQISKTSPTADPVWYAPSMADTDAVYNNEAAWKGAVNGVYAAGTQLTQQLPLEGQTQSQPQDTAYKYRARSLTKAYNGAVLHRSEWSAEAAALAKGTGVRDVVAAAIGTAQLQQKAVQNVNIDDAAVDIAKMYYGVRPTRTVSTLPALTDMDYKTGDTVVLTSDNKLYRRTVSGWTKAVDGADITARSIAAESIAANSLSANELAANSITAAQLAIGDFTNYATVNENLPGSQIPSGNWGGGTIHTGGYVTKEYPENEILLWCNLTPGTFAVGDEFYIEFYAKADAPREGFVEVWGYTAIASDASGRVGWAAYNGESNTTILTLDTTEQRFVRTLRIHYGDVVNSKYFMFGFRENTEPRIQVYFRKIVVRKKNAGEMIVDGAVTANKISAGAVETNKLAAAAVTGEKIDANTVNAANLNVLAKNVVNPFVDGTSEGWVTNGTVVNVDGLGYVLKLPVNPYFASNVFTVLPDDIYVFKFGLETLTALDAGLGLYFGLSSGQAFDGYFYNFPEKKWLLNFSGNTNSYFVENYTAITRKYFTTYILGSRVDISKVPAPSYTDETYLVRCLQLTGTNTACSLRSGNNPGQPADAAWHFIQPQVYRIGDGRVVARNIITENLSAINANLGRVTGDGNPNDSQYKMVLSDGFSGNENKKGTLLLGATTDDAYLRRWWNGSVWQMAIKLATFIVDSIASNVIGRFRVFRTGQNTASDKPTFDANPGSAAGSESTESRGAFRVRKSTSGTTEGEQVVLEALPNGNVNIPNGTLTAKYYGDVANYGNTGKEIRIGVNNPFDGQGESFLLISRIESPTSIEYKSGFVGRVTLQRGTTGALNISYNFQVVCTKAWRTFTLAGFGNAAIAGWISNPPIRACAVSYQNDYYLAIKIPNLPTHDINLSGELFGEFVGQVVQGATVVVDGQADMNISGGAVVDGILEVGTAGDYSAIVKGDTLQYRQGGIVKVELKPAMAAGVLSLLVSGLPFSCEGVTSSGDITGETADSAVGWVDIGDTKFGGDTIAAIAYGIDKFVAVGVSGKAAYSMDGASWTAVGDTKLGYNNIYGIAYEGGKFVAVGGGGKAAYSTDGASWTAVGDTKFGGDTIAAIAYGVDKFVAVGVSGKAAYSMDGASWTAVGDTKFGGNNINAVAYEGGKFVAVGGGGKAAYSTDGVTWTAVGDTKFGGNTIRAIAYGGGKFVAVGNTGKAAYSTDGVTWTAVGDTKFGASYIQGIAYGADKFVAVGVSGKAAYWAATKARLVFNSNGTVGWIKA